MKIYGGEPGQRLVLDTSAYSWMLNRHPVVLDLVAAASQVILSTISLGELEAGFEIGSRARQNRQALQLFLEEPFVAVANITAPVALSYGRLFAKLRRSGTPLPTNDIWIAATTLDCGGHLLTFDRHFERIPGLECSILEQVPPDFRQ